MGPPDHRLIRRLNSFESTFQHPVPQLNSMLGEMPAWQAIKDTLMPGCMLSSTRRIFWGPTPAPSLHRRYHLDTRRKSVRIGSYRPYPKAYAYALSAIHLVWFKWGTVHEAS